MVWEGVRGGGGGCRLETPGTQARAVFLYIRPFLSASNNRLRDSFFTPFCPIRFIIGHLIRPAQAAIPIISVYYLTDVLTSLVTSEK